MKFTFPPYTAGEIRSILSSRILEGLYHGVMSDEAQDLIIQYTMQSGDLRVGIDLIRRAVLNVEHDARHEVISEDISAAYEMARCVHLATCVRALSEHESHTLGHIAELSRAPSPHMTSGSVYGMVKESIGVGYTDYFEHLKKFDDMRLITLTPGRVRGNTREIALRYDADQVVEACGSGK
jgi:archaeal cell division control protein 6